MGTTAKKKAAPLTVSSFVIRTHTSTHYRRKTPNRPSAHPLPASPTASLNVRNLCSGECSGKGQPMVMPQLTLCFTAVSGRRRSPTDRSLTSTDSLISTTATATSNTHHAPNAGAFYKGQHPNTGFFRPQHITLFVSGRKRTTPDRHCAH